MGRADGPVECGKEDEAGFVFSFQHIAFQYFMFTINYTGQALIRFQVYKRFQVSGVRCQAELQSRQGLSAAKLYQRRVLVD